MTCLSRSNMQVWFLFTDVCVKVFFWQKALQKSPINLSINLQCMNWGLDFKSTNRAITSNININIHTACTTHLKKNEKRECKKADVNFTVGKRGWSGFTVSYERNVGQNERECLSVRTSKQADRATIEALVEANSLWQTAGWPASKKTRKCGTVRGV